MYFRSLLGLIFLVARTVGSSDDALFQVDTFLRDGVIVDICNGAPCQFDPP